MANIKHGIALAIVGKDESQHAFKSAIGNMSKLSSASGGALGKLTPLTGGLHAMTSSLGLVGIGLGAMVASLGIMRSAIGGTSEEFKAFNEHARSLGITIGPAAVASIIGFHTEIDRVKTGFKAAVAEGLAPYLRYLTLIMEQHTLRPQIPGPPTGPIIGGSSPAFKLIEGPSLGEEAGIVAQRGLDAAARRRSAVRQDRPSGFQFGLRGSDPIAHIETLGRDITPIVDSLQQKTLSTAAAAQLAASSFEQMFSIIAQQGASAGQIIGGILGVIGSVVSVIPGGQVAGAVIGAAGSGVSQFGRSSEQTGTHQRALRRAAAAGVR